VVETKSKNAADKAANPEKALPEISARHEKWARELEKQTESSLSRLILGAYRFRFLRRLCLALVRRVEGGEMHSTTLRRLLCNFHGVTIGPYSYGPCLVPGLLPRGTSVGNYCSVAEGLRVFRRNHPVGHLSQHPFFYNKELGLLNEDAIQKIQDNPLRIGHDVWIGAGVTILPGCKTIGDGAIIGAGAIVTRDIMPFTINVGNPARCIGARFSPEVRVLIEQTQWWELSLGDLGLAGNLLVTPVTKDGLISFLSHLESGNVAPH
jgi:virginiamycin A acetyltransferase